MNKLNHKSSIFFQSINTPCWIQMLNELHGVLGFSYSRIAYRIGCSPSGIQKLVKDFHRIPRDIMFFNLACYYHKLFYSEYSLPKAKQYVEANQDRTLCDVVIELINRGFLDTSLTPQENNFKKKIIEFVQQKGILGKDRMRVDTNIYEPQISAPHAYLI